MSTLQQDTSQEVLLTTDYRHDDYLLNINNSIPHRISREEVGDVHDPRYIYTGSPDNVDVDKVLDTSQLDVDYRRSNLSRRGEEVEELDNPWRVNLQGSSVNSVSSNPSISRLSNYTRRIPGVSNRRGNKAKDSPYDAKIRASIQIPVDEEIDDVPMIEDLLINIGPLTDITNNQLSDLLGLTDYRIPLSELKIAINNSNLATVPSSIGDRQYITNLTLSLIERYVEPIILAKNLDTILVTYPEFAGEVREMFPNIDEFLNTHLDT